MVHAIIQHKVKDFDRWLPAFRAHDPIRRQYGCKSAQVRRAADDPNDVIIEFEWDRKEGFREFMTRSDVRSVMELGGVLGEPQITLASDPVPWER